MKKIGAVFCLIIFFQLSTFAQEKTYKVVEKKGSVDVRVRSGKWYSVQEGDFMISGTEIFTGLHSHLSLEIENGSYITVKQLSHVIIDRVRLKKDEVNSEFYVQNGYVVVYSRKDGSLKNRVLLVFPGGNAQFENSGGELYYRSESGSVIKSFKGKVQIRSQVRNIYNLWKGEVAGVTAAGILVESDYFVRRKISTKPLEYESEGEMAYYFKQLLNYYSLDKNKTDYGEAFGN